MEEYRGMVPYAYVLGSLMLAMLYTRLDMCHAINMVSRNQSNPRPPSYVALNIYPSILRKC
jgi:hypothetical protein